MNSLKKLAQLCITLITFSALSYNLVWAPDWQVKRWPETRIRSLYISTTVKQALHPNDPRELAMLDTLADPALDIEESILQRLLISLGLTIVVTAALNFLPFLLGISKRERHLGGSQLVTPWALRRLILWKRLTAKRNRKTLLVFGAYFLIGAVLSCYLAIKTGALSSLLAVVVAVALFFLLHALSTNGLPKWKPIRIGGVPIPEEAEGTHFLIEGTTGSGKSRCIYGMISDARSRGDRGFVMDIAGAAAKRFARPGDLHLAFGENTSLKWSPFLDIRSAFDYAELARAAIPDGEGNGKSWHENARLLFQTVLQKLYETGDHSVAKLMYYVNNAPMDELRPFLEGTKFTVFSQDNNEQVLQNTRSVAVSCLQSWAFIPDRGDFSIRDWIRSSAPGQWLFVEYRDDQIAAIRQLLACWMQLAITETLSLDEEKTLPTWFVADEFDTLGQVSATKDALNKLRRYNGRCLFGMQTVAQPQATYGLYLTQVLLSCLSTKLYLRAGDPDTAEYCERSLGKTQIERSEVSRSQSSCTVTDRCDTPPLVLASKIANLPNLQGYLSIAGDWPIAKVKIPYGRWP